MARIFYKCLNPVILVAVLAAASVLYSASPNSPEKYKITKKISGNYRGEGMNEYVFVESPIVHINMFHSGMVFHDSACALDTFAIFLYRNISMIEKEFLAYQQKENAYSYRFSITIDSLGSFRYLATNKLTFCFDCNEKEDEDPLAEKLITRLENENWVLLRKQSVEILGGIRSQESEREILKRDSIERTSAKCSENVNLENDSNVIRTLRMINIPIPAK